MQQAVVVKPFEFEIKEIAPPALEEGFAVVEIVYCGVCGSDLHVYEGKHPKVKPPAVLGHEAVGYIKNVASNSVDFKVGDKVAVVPLIGCKKCHYCLLGYPNLCVERKVIGFQIEGCLAEEVAIPVENLIKLPVDCDLLNASLLEPLAVIVHSMKLLNKVNHSSDSVVITGAGTIGILAGLFLKENRNMNVYFVEINPFRKELVEKLGFQVFENLNSVPKENKRPVSFECTGNYKVLEGLVAMEPAPEVIVILGTFEKTLTFNIHEMCKWETYLIGSQMYTKDDLKEAAELMITPITSKFKEILVERIYSLEETKEAYDEALSTKTGTKVIIKVNKG